MAAILLGSDHWIAGCGIVDLEDHLPPPIQDCEFFDPAVNGTAQNIKPIVMTVAIGCESTGKGQRRIHIDQDGTAVGASGGANNL